MCGIVGYIGEKNACPILIEGLKRLEYRGYDSAGIAILNEGRIDIQKATGKLKVLEAVLEPHMPEGLVGLGHTRWATHGRPSDENAHPHSDCTGRITVVHNGIIENYLALKEELIAAGHHFTSETDTEIIAHLIEAHYKDDIVAAVRAAVKRLEGSFALAVIAQDDPERIVAARRHSPLVVGLGEGENFLASDVPAFLPYTKLVHFVEDDMIAVLRKDTVVFSSLDGAPVEREVYEVTWDAAMAERGGYEHFMLKEINEQPQALRETTRGRLSSRGAEVEFEDLKLTPDDLRRVEKITMVACGTAYHAAMVGKYAIEALTRIPVELDVASELRYRDPIIDDRTLALVISQSGETADTLAGLREARNKGASLIAVTNVVGSSVARDCESVLYTFAGPEIAVASTKAYTTQLMVIELIALYLAQVRGTLPEDQAKEMRRMLWNIPQQVEVILGNHPEVLVCADKYCRHNGFLYMGRGANLASALEGALKIKEIAYIHAEGYAAGEMKHGPIAMIDPGVATVAIAVQGKTYDKVISNILEVKARQGDVIAIAYEHDDQIHKYADHVIRIPKTHELLSPILAAIPLQLLAYHVAKNRGLEIDQPRNLAKSVTVE
jgi:glucosamine--fructose-6-phosphate aminotransferase (isomerizing)